MFGKHVYQYVVLSTTVIFSAGIFETSDAKTQLFDETFPKLVAARERILQNGRITPKQLIERHGYPFEEHNVVTEDDYILTLHRIPYGQYGPSANRIPIYLQHGLSCSSAEWVVTGPYSGPGFVLADAGYDVWLANSRGNTYSRKHKTLNPDSMTDKPIYWNFTIHHMGYYDAPAVIDYILQVTLHSNLFYLGHSMGTTIFYIMASTRPEYNDKVIASFSCGTCVYLQHMTSPVRPALTALYGIRDTVQALGIYEIFGQNDMMLGLDVWCAQYSPLADFCAILLQSLVGFDYGNWNETAQEEILQNYPAGTSTFTMNHITQNTIIGVPFMPYVYSILGNILLYPTRYPLSKVTVPVYMHICTHDTLTPEADVLRLKSALPNIKNVVTAVGCNHIDYVWGKNTREMYLYYIISVMSSLI